VDERSDLMPLGKQPRAHLAPDQTSGTGHQNV
jgi:hypothetical protein